MPSVNLKTHTIHYERLEPTSSEAEGRTPIVLVMGLSFSSRAWDTLPTRLRERAPVITIDNRGTGQSTLPRDPFRISDMANDVARILDAEKIDRAHVFGMSMGGMISIALAIRHGQRIRALALGCTHGGYLKSVKPSLLVLAKLMTPIMTGRIDAKSSASFLVSDEFWASDAPAFERWIRLVDRAPTKTTRAQIRAILLYGMDRRLHAIKAPTLVITGGADRLVPAENSRRLAKSIPGAKLVVLEGAGHCFAVEREEDTTRALLDFFAAHEHEDVTRALQSEASAP